MACPHAVGPARARFRPRPRCACAVAEVSIVDSAGPCSRIRWAASPRTPGRVPALLLVELPLQLQQPLLQVVEADGPVRRTPSARTRDLEAFETLETRARRLSHGRWVGAAARPAGARRADRARSRRPRRGRSRRGMSKTSRIVLTSEAWSRTVLSAPRRAMGDTTTAGTRGPSRSNSNPCSGSRSPSCGRSAGGGGTWS